MNGRKAKQIRAHVDTLSVAWIQGLLSEEEAARDANGYVIHYDDGDKESGVAVHIIRKACVVGKASAVDDEAAAVLHL